MSDGSPQRRRTSEEIKAMREAWMARRDGLPEPEAAPAPEPTPAAPEPEPTPAPVAAPAVLEEAKPEPPAAPALAPPPAPKPGPKPATTAKAKPARKKKAKKPEDDGVAPPVSRREFLNVAWLSAMALLTAQTVGVSVLFLYPNFREGEFGGNFPLGTAAEVLPEIDTVPVPYNDGKFWLTNTDQGVYALYKVCTHLGCLYAWIDTSHRFECPCHGSKFTLTGAFIEGPAPRGTDRFVITVVKPDGSTIETPPNGAGVQVDPEDQIIVDTGRKIALSGRDDNP